MNILLAIPLICSGLFVLVRRKQAARSGARFDQRMAQVIPWWGWANPNASEDAWRYMAPAIGVFMIVTGIALILFVPSN
jgi:hypothetical protein